MKSYDILRTARLLVVAVAVLVTQALAMPQSNQFVVEAPIGAAPLDLEITPNGAIAVVRGNIPGFNNASDMKVSLWATNTTNPILAHIVPTPPNAVGQGNLAVSPTGLPRFSDAVAVTNDRVIAVGSNGAEDTTYVDILSISYATDPPTATVLQSHSLSGTGTGFTAGLAHDVAITPDGALAVVSHRNWIHVFKMADGSIVDGLNIGASDSPGSAGFCDPGDSRNSVAVTNSRAVVTVRRPVQTFPFPSRTWVYIVDLDRVGDPVIRLEHDVGEVNGSFGTDTSPHDLAITPNGQRAVVTTSHKVALYDLVTNTALGVPHEGPLFERDWNGVGADLWDSVEVSDTRAVVLCSPPWGEPYVGHFKWEIHVFGIDGGALNLLQAYRSSNYPVSPPAMRDQGWDIALSDDGQYATVKTLRQDVALLDVINPGPSDIRRAGPDGTDADLIPSVEWFSGNDTTAVLKPIGNPPKVWGAFVGQGSDGVHLRFYELTNANWSLTNGTVLDVDNIVSTPSDPALPADLDRSLNGVEVLLRNSAPLHDTGQSGKPDWSRYSGVTESQIGASWGGQGHSVRTWGGVTGGVIAADVLRLGRGKAVSISWDINSPIPAGWVHIVTVQ